MIFQCLLYNTTVHSVPCTCISAFSLLLSWWLWRYYDFLGHLSFPLQYHWWHSASWQLRSRDLVWSIGRIGAVLLETIIMGSRNRTKKSKLVKFRKVCVYSVFTKRANITVWSTSFLARIESHVWAYVNLTARERRKNCHVTMTAQAVTKYSSLFWQFFFILFPFALTCSPSQSIMARACFL